MIKIKKELIFVVLFSLIITPLYANLDSKDMLRVPVNQKSTNERVIEAQYLIGNIDSQKLQKVFAFLAEQEELPLPANPAGILLLFGNDHIGTIKEAVKIYKEGRAKNIVVSGARGRLTEPLIRHAQENGYVIDGDFNTISEADIMKQVLMAQNIPADKIIIEDKATNTKENIDNTKILLETKGIEHNVIILMQKPLQQRRTRLTSEKTFERELVTDKIKFISRAAYVPGAISTSREQLIENIQLIMDEFRRFEEYGPRGKDHMKAVIIPEGIKEAYAYFSRVNILPSLKETIKKQRQIKEVTASQI